MTILVKMTRNVAVLLFGSAVCLFNVVACFDSTSTAFTLSSYNRSKKLLPPSNSIRSSSSSSRIQWYQQQQQQKHYSKKDSHWRRGRRGVIQSSACLSSLSSLLDKDDVQFPTTTSTSTTTTSTNNIQQTSSSSTISSPMSTPTSSQIIIRTTQPQDLSAIVNLLSYETATSTKTTALPAAATRINSIPAFPWNWKHHISKLKSHSNLHLQLSHRLAAKLALPSPTCSTSTFLDNELESSSSSSSHTSLHSIWLNHVWIHNDAYRNKVERAVKTTLDFYKEDIAWWQDWNFALTPKREMMFHFIMTALEDMECFVGKDDVEPVGFCELMMLKRPRVTLEECVGMDSESEQEEEEEEVFVPCIVNLVVSPNHRRRGIGKRLVECAVRAVRMYGKEWNVDSGVVGLFVEEDNVGAIALYESVGFRVREDVQKKECDYVSTGEQQIYMEMSMVDDDHADERKEKKKEYDSFLSSTSREEGSRLREQEGVAVATSR